jgi:hypothetical protein
MRDSTKGTTTPRIATTPKATLPSSIETIERKTLSVPEAGAAYFGLARDASYNAARRGQLPTIKMGRTLRVPIVLLEKMLLDAGK